MRNFLVVTAILAASAAQAATVGIEAGVINAGRPNDGLFSSYRSTPGIYNETFNSASQIQTCAIQNHNLKVSNLGTGDAGLASGRFTGRALPPGTNSASIAAGRVDTDKGCYLSTPNPLSPANQTATINPVQLTINLAPGQKTLYLGWYWGSIDPYNSVSFFDKLGNTILFSNVATSFGTGTVTGQDVINLFGLGASESRYIDFTFTAADNFGYALLKSGNTAFELDNVAYGATNPVPSRASAFARPAAVVAEPSLAGILGVGMICLVAGRTRRRPRA